MKLAMDNIAKHDESQEGGLREHSLGADQQKAFVFNQ